jgi:hypothetical protein
VDGALRTVQASMHKLSEGLLQMVYMPILLEKCLESVYYPKIWITVHPMDTNSRS